MTTFYPNPAPSAAARCITAHTYRNGVDRVTLLAHLFSRADVQTIPEQGGLITAFSFRDGSFYRALGSPRLLLEVANSLN